MTAPLYEIVLGLSVQIVNASEIDDEKAVSDAYKQLKTLCCENQQTNNDHPLQWEALGDFSDNHEDALLAYQQGLELAELLSLVEFVASIKFAMAERYSEQGNIADALVYAMAAAEFANEAANEDLQEAIASFVLEVENA